MGAGTLILIAYAAGASLIASLFALLAGWRWHATRRAARARLTLIQGGKDAPGDQADGLEAINATDTHGERA